MHLQQGGVMVICNSVHGCEHTLYTYSKVSLRLVVNHRSSLYTNCTTLKLVMHIANMVWSILVQRDDLYTYNMVEVYKSSCWFSAIKCIVVNINCTTPKVVLYVFVTSYGA